MPTAPWRARTRGAATVLLWLLTLLLLLPSGLKVRGNQLRPWCYSGTAMCRSGPAASPRYSHALAFLDSRAFVHGGRKSSQPSGLLDGSFLELLDMGIRTAQQQAVAWASGTADSTKSQPIPARAGHTLLPWGRKIVFFGGTTYQNAEVATHHVDVLDPIRMVMTRVTKDNATYGERGAALSGDCLKPVAGIRRVWHLPFCPNLSGHSPSTCRRLFCSP